LADFTGMVEASVKKQIRTYTKLPTRGLSKSTIELIQFAQVLLERDNPQTLRQLHYAIFSAAIIAYQNDLASYRRLSRVTTIARRLYRAWELDADADGEAPKYSIDPEWMIDETRAPENPNVWDDADQYIKVIARSYRRDNWRAQPNYVEIWCEKGTVLAALRPVADKFGITLRTLHGFGSCGQESEIGRTFEGLSKKDIHVLFLGDFDSSGECIESEFHARAEKASGVNFNMQRLAIHRADIRKFNLPPQTIKDSDPRAAAFKKRHGKKVASVELDALPAAELRRRCEEAISGLIDQETWAREQSTEAVEFECIRNFANTLKNLPQLRAPR
jgi:hypothetical protein